MFLKTRLFVSCFPTVKLKVNLQLHKQCAPSPCREISLDDVFIVKMTINHKLFEWIPTSLLVTIQCGIETNDKSTDVYFSLDVTSGQDY